MPPISQKVFSYFPSEILHAFLFYACYMLLISLRSLSDHPYNILYAVYITQIVSFATSFYFLSLRPKFSPQHSVVKSRSVPFPQDNRPCFATVQNCVYIRLLRRRTYDLLTTYSSVILRKPQVDQLLKNFPIFYGTAM
jgi:hypothetical protein